MSNNLTDGLILPMRSKRFKKTMNFSMKKRLANLLQIVAKKVVQQKDNLTNDLRFFNLLNYII